MTDKLAATAADIGCTIAFLVAALDAGTYIVCPGCTYPVATADLVSISGESDSCEGCADEHTHGADTYGRNVYA